MQSLFSVTIQANGTAAHLQYALQEGQRDYSYALQAPDFQLKSSYANQVRASDQKVGLLQARMTQVLLSLGDRAPAARFWDDWEAYTESRDMGLARALQGRAPVPSETQAIIARFERLTNDVHNIEEQFHAIAARQAEQVRHSLMLAGVEMACSLCAAAFS